MAGGRGRQVGLFDVFAGRRLRHRRMKLAMPLEALAGRAQLSVQQIQKYEAGENRMSAGRIAQLGAIVGMAPADFLWGAEALRKALAAETTKAADVARQIYLCDLLIAYLDTGSAAARRRLLEAVQAASGRQLKDRDLVVFELRPAPGSVFESARLGA